MLNSTLIQISPEDLTKMIVEAIGTLTPAAPSSETLLSKKEVCAFLDISLNTLDKFTKSGTIPAYGIGSRILYKKSDVLASLIRINK